MNYIQQLNAQIEALKTQRDAAREQLQELKSYLTSSKFAHGSELDGYVSAARSHWEFGASTPGTI